MHLNVISACVRALTAVSRAMLTCRIISQTPSALFGIPAGAGEHGTCSRFGVERVGLAVGATAASVAEVDLDDPVAVSAYEARQARSIAASPLDPEDGRSIKLLRP